MMNFSLKKRNLKKRNNNKTVIHRFALFEIKNKKKKKEKRKEKKKLEKEVEKKKKGIKGKRMMI